MKNKLLPFLLLFCLPLKAEPDKTARQLINDSPSMLEWGMFKIENKFSTVNYKALKPVVENRFNVDYDWDRNELELTMVVYPSYEVINEHGAKEICRKVLTSIKNSLGFSFINSESNYLSISRYFEHRSFTRTNKTDTFSKDIEKMTRVTVSVHSSKADTYPLTNKAECTNKFLEKAIYFEDKQ